MAHFATAGELVTRLRDRGCNGDGGKEFDLFKAWRVGCSAFSRDEGGLLATDDGAVDALSAFRLAFITSVAKMAFSLDGNVLAAPASGRVFKAAPREAGRATFVVFVCVATRPLAPTLDPSASFSSIKGAFDIRSSLSAETVVEVHVPEASALLTESAFVCRVAMLVF